MKRTILIALSLAIVATAGCYVHSESTKNRKSSGASLLGLIGYSHVSSKQEYKECIEEAPATSPDLRPFVDPCRDHTTAGTQGGRHSLLPGQLAYNPLLAGGYGYGGYGYGMSPYLIPAPMGRHALTGTMFDPVQAAYALDRGVVQQAAANTPPAQGGSSDKKIYKQVEALRKDVQGIGGDLEKHEGRLDTLEKK